MFKITLTILLVSIILLFQGCSTKAPRYSDSVSQEDKRLLADFNEKIIAYAHLTHKRKLSYITLSPHKPSDGVGVDTIKITRNGFLPIYNPFYNKHNHTLNSYYMVPIGAYTGEKRFHLKRFIDVIKDNNLDFYRKNIDSFIENKIYRLSKNELDILLAPESSKSSKNKILVEHNPFLIKEVNNPNEELQLLAINNKYKAIEHITDPTPKVQKIAIEKDYEMIKVLYNPSEEVQLIAVKHSPSIIKHIKNPTEKVQQLAIKNNYTLIENINNPTPKIQRLVKKLEKEAEERRKRLAKEAEERQKHYSSSSSSSSSTSSYQAPQRTCRNVRHTVCAPGFYPCRPVQTTKRECSY